jgi:NAD(P) transhydrogenase
MKQKNGAPMRYNLLVIGDAPGGPAGALAAARRKQRVAIIELLANRRGAAPAMPAPLASTRLRCAVRAMIASRRQREENGSHSAVAMDAIRRQLNRLVQVEREALHERFERDGIDVYTGDARFAGAHDVELLLADSQRLLYSDAFLLACGTRAARPQNFAPDGDSVFDSDSLLGAERLPESLIVLGGKLIGIEYAALFASYGVRVTVVGRLRRRWEHRGRPQRPLVERALDFGVTFRTEDEAIGIDSVRPGRVVVRLESGRRLVGESALVNAGRVANTDSLNLSAAGIEPDERGRLWCNANQQTWADHIYAAGDVVGYPRVNGLPTEQARVAVRHAFRGSCRKQAASSK